MTAPSAEPAPVAPRAPGTRGIAMPLLIALALMLLVAVASLETLAAVRAYVEGESLYSKGQKDAVFYLSRFAEARAAADFEQFERAVAKPLGDREARLALSAPVPDLERAVRGFVAGGNSRDDVGRLIWFYRLFHRAPPFQRAIDLWTRSDRDTERLAALAGELRAAAWDPARAAVAAVAARGELATMQARVAPLEDAFSATLGEAARGLTTGLELATLALGATMALLGLRALRWRLSERQRYESALRVSEGRYRSLFESSNDAVLLANGSGTVLDANPAACRLFALGLTQLRSHSLEQLVVGGERWFDGAAQPAAGARRDVTLQRTGASYTGEVSCMPFHDSDGALRYSVTIHDVTERRRMEGEQRALAEELQRARQMEAIGHLAGGIAHDFNNILSAVLGYAGLLERELAGSPRAHGWAMRIAESGKRARDLVQQILAFARKGGVERVPADVIPIIGETCELLRASLPATVGFSVSLPPGPIVVRVNHAQLSQVIVNLCINAKDALQERVGSISVELALVEPGDPELTGFAQAPDGSTVAVGTIDPAQRYARIAVSDTGSGMSADVLQRIFTPFYTTKRRGHGTGLGLAVVHGIVMDSAGGCRVASQYGFGSVFAVYLPVIEAQAARVANAAPRAPRAGDARVLVIDDEPFVADVIEAGLAQLGYAVTTATDPIDALAAVATRPQDFDVVITDQVMPRMTGLEVLQRIRRLRPSLPVIVCTGFSNAATDEAVRAAGAVAFFHKPVAVEQLAECIQRLCGTPAAAVEPVG